MLEGQRPQQLPGWFPRLVVSDDAYEASEATNVGPARSQAGDLRTDIEVLRLHADSRHFDLALSVIRTIRR
jgi:hypothetical protein